MSVPPIISQKNKSAKDSLIHWKSENPNAYSDFIRKIDLAKDGDYSAYIKIFETAIQCIPQEVIDECKVMFGNTELSKDAYYEELIDEFMDFQGFIKLSFAEGDIEVETVADKNIEDTASIFIPVKGKDFMSMEQILQMWKDRNLPGEVIDATPTVSKHRGDEIDAWLAEYGKPCQYVILDDMPFSEFNLNHYDHFVMVNAYHGLDEEIAERAIAIL